MPTQPEERRRLAELMEKRRLELGLRWQDVADAGGVSLRAVNAARTGDADIRPLTRAGIARGLQWSHDSVDRILDGGDPLPAPAGQPATPAPVDLAAIEAAVLDESALTPEARAAAIRAIRRAAEEGRRTGLSWHLIR